MGVNRAVRADDVSGLNIATTQFTDTDAVAKDFQRIVINDSTSGTMAAVGGAGLKVDGSGATQPVSGTVAVSGTPTVRPSDGTNPISKTFDLDSSGSTHEWNIGVGLRKAASGGSVEAGTATNPLRTDPTGTTVQGVSGTVSANQGGTWTVQPGNTANTTAWKVDGSAVTQPVSGTVTATLSGSISNTGFNVTPATSGGVSAYHAVAAASNNAASVKGSAGQVYGWSIYNNAGYPIYVKLYNKATSPAPATDNALLIKVIGVQAGTHVSYSNVCGIAGFTSGIGIAAVKGITDTDNTSLVLSDCLIEVDYK